MLKRTIAITISSLIIASACGYLIYTSISLDDTFLLVETERVWHTELVEGNYTDGHCCFDFPMYSIDEDNKTIYDRGNTKNNSFKVAYGSGSFGNGLIDSGGASGLQYINELPFNKRERVRFADTYFFINITIKDDYQVFINETELLKPGESKIYTYDIVKEYTNHFVEGDDDVMNSICVIRYTSNTTVKNYGHWKKATIDFKIIIGDRCATENIIIPIMGKKRPYPNF